MKPAWIALSGVGFVAAAITAMALVPQFYLSNIIVAFAGIVIGAIGLMLWLDDCFDLFGSRLPDDEEKSDD